MSTDAVSTNNRPWWKDSVIYQIYPASFYCQPNSPCPPNRKDAAVGNIRGLISKVPYIASLGFDALWLSPIFASPQHDMGYDVSDYRDIYRPYGSVKDVQDLIDTLHSTIIPEPNGPGRKMRLLMDLVVNHTSSEHPWFLESSSSTSNPKSNWYFWRDPKTDPQTGERSEPNNWRSIFGGPAWHYVPARNQYYLALFLPSQPDLNWEITEMRTAIYDDMRFWLDRGVDGWRIDSMNLMSKHPSLPDARIIHAGEKYHNGAEFYASGPKMHDYLQEMRREVFDRYDAVFNVGEMGSVESEESVAHYVAASRHELNCVFQGMDLDFGPVGKYDGSDPFHVRKLRAITAKWQTAMPRFQGWNSIYLDNHDSGRSLCRYTSDHPDFRTQAAKMLATYLCTLSGTVFALAGQEIGMTNLPADVGIEGYVDVEGQNWYHKTVRDTQPDQLEMKEIMAQLQLKSRDHGRLPMQWDDGANAGFCDADMKPWMTVNPDYRGWNVKSQEGQSGSVLEYWKQVIRFRRAYSETVVHGSFEALEVEETGEEVVGYERCSVSEGGLPTASPPGGEQGKGVRVVVLLSFSEETVAVPSTKYKDWTPVIGNIDGFEGVVGKDGKVVLKPYEAVVLRAP